MAVNFAALGVGDKIGIGLGVGSLVTGLIGAGSKANTENNNINLKIWKCHTCIALDASGNSFLKKI